MKLREPDNRIENVVVGADHIANVRAAVKLERARLEKAGGDAEARPRRRLPRRPPQPRKS